MSIIYKQNEHKTELMNSTTCAYTWLTYNILKQIGTKLKSIIKFDSSTHLGVKLDFRKKLLGAK